MKTPATTSIRPTTRSLPLAYWQLTKSLQTFLLVVTGLAGFMSGMNPSYNWYMFLGGAATLFLTIAGTTVFNMIWDKDIDSVMSRTCRRPLPTGVVDEAHAMLFGLVLLSVGLAWGFVLNPVYGLVLTAGFLFDFVIYTVWLKRRSPWSIIWGGLSGAMPILAGRVLATGSLDLAGISLALGILLWIPVHILTFAIKYDQDYRRAHVPTFVQTLGVRKTRIIIALSSMLSALSFIIAADLLMLSIRHILLLVILGLGLTLLSIFFIFKPTDKVNFLLFKAASMFMLLSNIVIATANL